MFKKTIILPLFLIAISTDNVLGQTFVETLGKWSAFKDGKGKSRSCYVASAPQRETGNYKRRGNTFVLVSHRPGEGSRDVFELRAGYTYKKNTEVIVSIDGQKFKLFTKHGTAWAKDSKTDRALVRAMIRGRTMTVEGSSVRGTNTSDTYSLKGFTAAYNMVGRDCDVK